MLENRRNLFTFDDATSITVINRYCCYFAIISPATDVSTMVIMILQSQLATRTLSNYTAVF